MKKHDGDEGDSINFLLVAIIVFVVIVLFSTHGLPAPHGLLVPP